ncbi:hypothetical protein MKD33_07205, partial [Chromobacterium piscinae]
AGNRNAA